MSRVYISGPITGIPGHNKPAFAAAAEALKKIGHDPVNPHDIVTESDLPWEMYLRADLTQLLTCDAITLLRGHQNSRGSALERHVADALGFEHIELPNPKEHP